MEVAEAVEVGMGGAFSGVGRWSRIGSGSFCPHSGPGFLHFKIVRIPLLPTSRRLAQTFSIIRTFSISHSRRSVVGDRQGSLSLVGPRHFPAALDTALHA